MTYEAIIKVRRDDPPETRAREIAEGIGYAAALLLDEYGWSALQVQDVLDRVSDDVEQSFYARNA